MLGLAKTSRNVRLGKVKERIRGLKEKECDALKDKASNLTAER